MTPQIVDHDGASGDSPKTLQQLDSAVMVEVVQEHRCGHEVERPTPERKRRGVGANHADFGVRLAVHPGCDCDCRGITIDGRDHDAPSASTPVSDHLHRQVRTSGPDVQ